MSTYVGSDCSKIRKILTPIAAHPVAYIAKVSSRTCLHLLYCVRDVRETSQNICSIWNLDNIMTEIFMKLVIKVETSNKGVLF